MARLGRTYPATSQHARLGAPVVVNEAVVFVAAPIKVQFADLEDRAAHNSRQRHARPFYTKANVIDPGIAFRGPRRRCVGTNQALLLPPRAVHSRLRPPVVVTAISTFVASPVSTALAPQRRGTAKPFYIGPRVIPAPASQRGGILTQYVRTPRTHTTAKLGAPAVAAAVTYTFAGPDAHLTYSLRGKAKPRLLPVPAAFRPFPGVKPHLAPSHKGRITLTVLRAPVVVGPVLARPIDETLAPQKRGVPKSILRKPTVVGPVLARAIDTTLVRIRPRHTLALLGKPADTVGLEDQGRVAEHLAYSRRGTPRSDLRAPVVVDAFRIPVVEVKLAYSLRGRPKSILGRPTDLVDQQDVGRVAVHLAPSFRGRPSSHLFPPTVVFPFFARPTNTTLAYSLRGRPKSILRKPAVIDLRPQTYFVRVDLVRIRPAHTIGKLSPPAVINYAPPVDTIIEKWQVRIKPQPVHSILRKPVVVGPVLARAIDTTFAPQKRGRAKSILRKPTVIDLRPQAKYLAVTLAYSLRGKAKPLLPETIVPTVSVRPALVTLAPQPRPTTISTLRPPAVVTVRQAGTTSVTLAPQSRGVARSVLLPPAVTGAGIAFFGPTVTTIRIRPVTTQRNLYLPASVVVERGGTIYCGDDPIYTASGGDSVAAGAAYSGSSVDQGVAYGGVVTDGTGIVSGGDSVEGRAFTGNSDDGMEG